MKISLDYDDTITADVEFWLAFIQLARKYQHEVFCITGRSDTESNREEMKFLEIPKIYCDHGNKRTVSKNRGIEIDVWIDDIPEMICGNCEQYSQALGVLDARYKRMDSDRALAYDLLADARNDRDQARSTEAEKLQKEMGQLRQRFLDAQIKLGELENDINSRTI